MNVDADVVVDRGRAIVLSLDDSATIPVPKAFYTIAGYAPLRLQALLVRYWETHGRPRSIRIAPGDATANVAIEDLGAAQLKMATATLSLRRYSIDGVAWGREIIYLDADSNFAAIVTRANMLPLEGIREDLAVAHGALLDSIQADAARAELAAAARASVPAIATGTFAVVGARIVDGTTRPPIEDGVILVRGGRIAAVGSRLDVSIREATRTIDARGKTIIPGLWDMHAHVALPEWGPAYLGVGVTSVRDMGGENRFLIAFRDAIQSGALLGPGLLLAGLSTEAERMRSEPCMRTHPIRDALSSTCITRRDFSR